MLKHSLGAGGGKKKVIYLEEGWRRCFQDSTRVLMIEREVILEDTSAVMGTILHQETQQTIGQIGVLKTYTHMHMDMQEYPDMHRVS